MDADRIESWSNVFVLLTEIESRLSENLSDQARDGIEFVGSQLRELFNAEFQKYHDNSLEDEDHS